MIGISLLSAIIAHGATSLPEQLDHCREPARETLLLERDVAALADAGLARESQNWLEHIALGQFSAEDTRMGLAISVINLATAQCAARVLEGAFGGRTRVQDIEQTPSTRLLADQLALFAGTLHQLLKYSNGAGFVSEMRRFGLSRWLDMVIERLGDPSMAASTIADIGEQIVFEATSRVLAFQAALKPR